MGHELDQIDRTILRLLQKDASLSVDDISGEVHLSRNACWRRIKAMEQVGIIKGRVALIDPASVGVPLTAIVLIRTNAHDAAWMKKFQTTLQSFPEIVGAYRMTGDLDYMLRVRVADVPAYDAFYKRLTSRISVSDISASFVMEEIKETTAVPL
ncbi:MULTISPECIES: Lrp/AsnC family transcriptional regulator [unclassified Cognatiyoonia]|uniref:Lrp/AsnC family transcriptional regulator n=1 Tax=unclassified Cognatiyoonia TaxID=2635977 RepID=UPI002A0D3FD4|nr:MULTISPECIES: Lrp/AsnC family transcriptional regulator [unclassified Cognatiyoonia]MDX8346706.1 Lrp/AsnC family transcriptional regulator [Cognatiyoonia sp. IB215446]MDX8352808.1 Lrp/AsnC family transcriptional regulator [Cognatiyoonia sp. IB215182]